MENNLQIFNNDMFGEVKFIVIDGKPYALANDVAKCLGYKVPKDAISRHCKGALFHRYHTKGGEQESKFIPEGDIYRLIVKSNLPESEKFECWIFDELLPVIRKTGGYISNADLMVNTYFGALHEDHKMIIKGLFTNIEEQQKTITEQRKEIEHKENVIIGLVDEVDLATKRQILNRVVKSAGTQYIGKRWAELYKQFEMKYHLNLKIRLENYNSTHKPKLKNKLDYIDKELNKVPELYEIACKLYENDVKELIKEMYELNNNSKIN